MNPVALGAIVAAPIIATLLHELTHYVLAALLFVEARIIRPEPWRLAVEYDMHANELNEKLSTIVNLSPGIIGLSLWILGMFWGLTPTLSVDTAWLYAGSLVYIVGGPGDYLI
jgi:sulfite exporter TauE/SafE